MNRSTDERLCIVLLAAGAASRFGSAKQIADIDGVAMVRHCVQNAIRTEAPVLVVTGAHRDAVERELRDLDVALIRNDEWQHGMGGSIASGVRGAVDRYPRLEAVLIVLGDQPALSSGNLLALIHRHGEKPECIISSKSNGALGPPCIFPLRFFHELMELRELGGARHVVDRHPDALVEIELPEAGIDIDSPADHAKFLALRTQA
jgi:molybdenum cofactor cytidylyltransferase